MKGNKKIDELFELYEKQLKRLFKYNKKNAKAFDTESRLDVQDQSGVFVIFNDEKQPIFVGQAGGYYNNQVTKKDLNDKLGQFNLKSDVSTMKLKKGIIKEKDLSEENVKNVKAEDYNLKFQYIEIKGNPAFINIFETLALEYAKEQDINLYNFI